MYGDEELRLNRDDTHGMTVGRWNPNAKAGKAHASHLAPSHRSECTAEEGDGLVGPTTIGPGLLLRRVPRFKWHRQSTERYAGTSMFTLAGGRIPGIEGIGRCFEAIRPQELTLVDSSMYIVGDGPLQHSKASRRARVGRDSVDCH